GQKMYVGREEMTVMVAAHRMGQAIKWIEDRAENLIAGGSSRQERAAVSMAVDGDGRIMATTADITYDVGSYLLGATSTSSVVAAMMFPGPYRIPRQAFTQRTAYTTTNGRVPYRGPWMIETVTRELMIDRVAREIGLDPLELRRRNII